jgi:hypothetical protein
MHYQLVSKYYVMPHPKSMKNAATTPQGMVETGS